MICLGIDIGTTHIKVGLFARGGRLLFQVRAQNVLHQAAQGYQYFDPEELWATVTRLVRQATAWVKEQSPVSGEIAGVGVASMAETGLLLDRLTGIPRTPLLPWFDPLAAAEAEALKLRIDIKERFLSSGLRPSAKWALVKWLWLRAHRPELLPGGIWLSTADYIVYRLTGRMVSDFSLAGRTYAFDLQRREWDRGWLDALELGEIGLPQVVRAGSLAGEISAGFDKLGLLASTPVTVAGHDHVCGSLAAILATGGPGAGVVFNSMGTAESLTGLLPEKALGDAEFACGLSHGCHILPGYLYWMGGLSASGGSIEWLRGILGEPRLSYAGLEQLAEDLSPGPGDILYFPYLSGSAAPHTDSLVRGAFTGLSAHHTRADLYRAVLEGAAYELEVIHSAAQRASGMPTQRLVAAGGGTLNRRWMQIKADVAGCRIDALEQAETTLMGAALLGGLAGGVYADLAGMAQAFEEMPCCTYFPDEERHQAYRRCFDDLYLAFQEPLRRLAYLATQV